MRELDKNINNVCDILLLNFLCLKSFIIMTILFVIYRPRTSFKKKAVSVIVGSRDMELNLELLPEQPEVKKKRFLVIINFAKTFR